MFDFADSTDSNDNSDSTDSEHSDKVALTDLEIGDTATIRLEGGAEFEVEVMNYDFSSRIVSTENGTGILRRPRFDQNRPRYKPTKSSTPTKVTEIQK